MIYALRGKIVTITPQTVIILVNGIEYSLFVSAKTIEKYISLSSEDKNDIRVFTHMIVRDDGVSLYGFYDISEKETFLKLQSVPGIGAKQSIKILSTISVKDLVSALDRRDVDALSRIPGIGKKTSQNLILQLRDTLVYTNDTEDVVTTQQQSLNDLIAALTDMGYEKKKVNNVVKALAEENKAELAKMDLVAAESLLFPLALRRLS